MSSNAQYAAIPKVGFAQISVANTARDGTGTMVTVLSAGTGGSRVDDIAVVATGVTTDGMVRLFLNNGSVSILWKEIPVGATVASGTKAAFNYLLFGQALILPTGWSLKASTNNAESFNVIVTRAGDF